MRVYIAGPYTKGDVAANVRKAIWYADEIAALGHFPYIPHLTHFWHLLFPHDWELWLKLDLEWLSLCDVVLRILGESEGADREVEEARQLGIPVVYSLPEMLQHVR